jgi:hypothetical protein
MELKRQQTLATILRAVVVGFGGAYGAPVADVDETSMGDGESNARLD